MKLLLNQDPAAGGGGTATTTQPDWTTGLPEDAKPFIQGKGWKTSADMYTSYRNLEKVLGNNMPKPQPDWDDAKWGEFHKAAGRPETPDKYELPMDALKDVKVDDGRVKKWRENFHKYGLSDRQAKALWNDYIAEETTASKSIEAAHKQEMEVGEMKLRNEWGNKYDTNLAAARAAINKLGPEFEQFLTTTALGNNPTLIKLFHSISTRISEDRSKAGDAGDFGANSPDAAQHQIKKLQTDAEFWKKFTDSTHPDHKATAQMWEKLHEVANPKKAA